MRAGGIHWHSNVVYHNYGVNLSGDLWHLQFPLSLVSWLTSRAVYIVTVLKLYGWALPGKNDLSIFYPYGTRFVRPFFFLQKIAFKYHTCCWHWYMKTITVSSLYIFINLWLSTVSVTLASRDRIFQMTQLVKVILGCWCINCWESTSDFLITGAEPKNKTKQNKTKKQKKQLQQQQEIKQNKTKKKTPTHTHPHTQYWFY